MKKGIIEVIKKEAVQLITVICGSLNDYE